MQIAWSEDNPILEMWSDAIQETDNLLYLYQIFLEYCPINLIISRRRRTTPTRNMLIR
jgi:hypothetical protein